MIVKVRGGYDLLTHNGSRVLGHHRTRAQALAQEGAIYASKARRGRRNPSTSVDDGGRHRAANRLADAYREYTRGEWTLDMRDVEELANRVSRREASAREAGVSGAEIKRMYAAIRGQEKGARHNPWTSRSMFDYTSGDRTLGPGHNGLYRVTDKEAKGLVKHIHDTLPKEWEQIRVELPDGRHAWLSPRTYSPDRTGHKDAPLRGWIWVIEPI